MEDSFFGRFFRSGNRQKPYLILMRSGLVTAVVLTFLLLVLGLIWRQRGRGNLHRLTAHRVVETAPPLRPGGQDPITLTRLSLLNGAIPEFLSAELLPGLGMQVLQLTANLPNKGEIPLLASPGLSELDSKQPITSGAAFRVTTDFVPKHNQPGTEISLSSMPASTVENNTMPDGGAASARFFPASSDSNGVATENGIEMTISALLSGHTLDLTMTARNVTEQSHTVELSWEPRFRAPSGNLHDLQLVVPSSDRILGNIAKSVHGSADDFSGPSGAPLGQSPIHVTYTNLKRGFLGNGPVVELRDMRNDFRLRLTAISPSIRSLRVNTSPDNRSIELAYSTADHAASHANEFNTTVLRPGQRVQWKVRLEVVPLSLDRELPQVGGFTTGHE